MDLDKIVDFLNQRISENIGKSLNDSEIKLLQGSLKGWKYREIAKNENYTVTYLERQLGPTLWRNISKALGVKVKKSNIRGVLEKKLREQQSRFTAKLPSQEISQKEVVAGSMPIDVDTLVWEVRSQYRQKIQDQCGTVRLLGIDKPIKINDPERKGIYVDVYTIKDRPRQKWLETSDLDSGEIHQERELGLEVVARYTKLLVLGQPGFGKTTFLKYLAIQCNEGRFQPEKIPIFIELQRFAKKVRKLDKFSLINYVSQQINRFVSEQQIESMLSEGRFLILLDGLDEVKKDERNKVIEELDDFFESYNKNQFIITCRLEAQEYKFQNFSEVELAGFNPRQIEIFSQQWFGSADKALNREYILSKTNRFIEELERPENQRIYELAKTPLLLNLLCWVFRAKESFLSKRSELYKEALDLLLCKWDEFDKKNLIRQEVVSLSLSDKINLLKQIAFITFKRNEYVFEQDRVQELIGEYLENLNDITTIREKLRLDGEAVLKSIEAQHGLLVKQAWGVYSFSHLTFQEYLTAREFASSRQQQGLEKLVSHLTDSRWREVFLLVSEMTTPADELLRLMKKKIDELPHDSYLQEFLTEVNKKSCSVHIPYQYRSHSRDTSKSFRAAYRAFYLSSVLDLDLTLERAFWDAESLSFDHTLDYASGISIPFSNIYYLREYSFASSIISAFPRIRESAYSPISALEIARIFEPAIADKLLELLKPLKEQINNQKNANSREPVGEWWKANGQAWTKQLKEVMIKYRKIVHDCHNWKFSSQQMESLKHYYDANQLLLDCLERACDVNNLEQREKIQDEIEETLLLPIAEIEQLQAEGNSTPGS